MNKAILMIILAALMSGCSLFPERVKIREVPVPILVYRDVIPAEVDEMPRLPIYDLTENSSEDEILIAISNSLVILESQRKQLEEAMKPFRDSRDDVEFKFQRILDQYFGSTDSAISITETPIED